MSYILKQYNYNRGDIITPMNPITSVKVVEVSSNSDIMDRNTNFKDQCIQLDGSSFVNNKNYYFHGKIKRLDTDQTFNIKLVNYDSYSDPEHLEQFIKSITINKGNITPPEDQTEEPKIPCEWVDIEFMFTPYDNFDAIVFELKRIYEDYITPGGRTPRLCYEEISDINNLINPPGQEYIKIGVQSRPGFLMCINGEEIRIGRSGIYELKNGVILTSFFSVVAGANETQEVEMKAAMAQVDKDYYDGKTTSSINWITGKGKQRIIDGFTLDYLYKDET